LSVYAGTPHQALVRHGAGSRPYRMAGALLLLIALVLLLTMQGPATAVFTG